MYISEILAMPNGNEKIKELAVEGLINRETHHKQWFFEQILLSLDVDLEKLYLKLEKEGWIDENEEGTRGVPP